MNSAEKRFLTAVFMASLILKLFYGYVFENKFHPLKYDFGPYETMAANFSHGKGLIYETKINETLTITRYNEDELAYPLMCGFVYTLTRHSVIIMLLIQCLYASLIPVVIYLISKSLFNVDVGRLSALLAIFVPGIMVYAAAKIHSMTFYSLVFCAALWAAVRFMRRQSAGNVIFLGIMLGLGILSRNNFVFFIPFLLLYFYLTKKAGILNILKIAVIIIIVLTPLAVRNYSIYHKIVILKPGVTWPAMNAKAMGTLYNNDGTYSFEDVNKQLFSGYSHLTDLEYATVINKAVMSNIKRDKLKYLSLSLKRFYYFWWFSPDTGREYPRLYLLLYKPYYIFTLLFALIGIVALTIRSIKDAFLRDNQWLLILIFIISTTIPHYLYYGEGRHRFALEPLLLIFTSYGIFCFYNNIRNRIKPI